MYEEIEDACQEELNKADNNLIRRSLALNLFATFSILRGKCDIGIEHLTTIIETPGTPTKVLKYNLFCVLLNDSHFTLFCYNMYLLIMMVIIYF